jgi:hypothetical protein
MSEKKTRQRVNAAAEMLTDYRNAKAEEDHILATPGMDFLKAEATSTADRAKLRLNDAWSNLKHGHQHDKLERRSLQKVMKRVEQYHKSVTKPSTSHLNGSYQENSEKRKQIEAAHAAEYPKETQQHLKTAARAAVSNHNRAYPGVLARDYDHKAPFLGLIGSHEIMVGSPGSQKKIIFGGSRKTRKYRRTKRKRTKRKRTKRKRHRTKRKTRKHKKKVVKHKRRRK